MDVTITKGIKITVTTKFCSELTKIERNIFFFNYTIEIENLSHYRVQLISRHWRIMDSLGPVRNVDGVGVVGVQPVLEHGETHAYTSGCDLNSSLGYMEGYYNFITINDNGEKGNDFKVIIPRFKLQYQGKLN